MSLLKDLVRPKQITETAAYFPLTPSEARVLIKYLEEMDKKHDGIPAPVQAVAEKLHAFILKQ